MKGREVLVIMVQEYPLATPTFRTQIFSHSDSSSLRPASTPPTRLPWIWEVPEAPEIPGEQPRGLFISRHRPPCVPGGAGHLSHEPGWQTKGARCGQAGQGKPAWGVGVSREKVGNSWCSTEIWGFQEGFRGT